jgi:uncharacterized protein YfaS (alpha-2-macroglobulin family)
MEKVFYTLEQSLMQPVYALYPWTPDAALDLPPAERQRFEQALFARTAWIAGGYGMDVPRDGDRHRIVQDRPGPTGPHTLAFSSFPVKAQETQRERREGLDRVRVLWGVLAVALGLAAYVGLWSFVRPVRVVVLIHGVALIFLLGMAVPLLWFGKAQMRFAADGLQAEAMAREGSNWERLALDGSGEAVRVRERFPETLLWQPQLITDDQGQAILDIQELADSITTWRLTASAVTTDGRLGATQTGLRVFQPFFVDLDLPVALTRGDETAVRVVVHNHLKQPQTVQLRLDDADWFERLEDASKTLDLPAEAVRAVTYRLRVKKVGEHHLQVSARTADVADAVKRRIEVVPDGRREDRVFNGSLAQAGKPVELTLDVPADAIEDSAKALVKIYPSGFSQLVEGLENIFHMPSGCFEQTSSTTYPNVLALDYLRRHNKNVPEVEAKARQYIHLGYQRLLTFEVAGGGFEWFGHSPAHPRLTAYGLMELQDMAKVHDVDPKLIERTRAWLLRQRNRDGSWSLTPGLHAESDPSRGQQGDLARLSLTAYIAWAVFGGNGTDAGPTRDFLLTHQPESIPNPYTLALVCNALLALDSTGRDAGPYLDRLESLKQATEGLQLVSWQQRAGDRTAFYGTGTSGDVETTALAVLALTGANRSPGTVNGALAWLVKHKDAHGTWHSTQATVLALKALLAGKSVAGDRDRRFEIALGDGVKQEVLVPKDQAEVMQQLDLSKFLKPGANRLTLTEHTDTASGYQVAFRYHVPGAAPDRAEPLAITLTYDRTDLAVGELMTATAVVENRLKQPAPMVMLDLPIPAGFRLVAEDLNQLVAAGTVARYQLTPRSAIVYLRGLEPGKPLQLTYRLRAELPVKVAVPPARVYEYYDPDQQGFSRAVNVRVQ